MLKLLNFMKPLKKLLAWAELHSSVPAYGGWVLFGLILCFWLAAANTMAGWLYVLSGLGVSLLLLSALMPARTILGIQVGRSALYPIHAGESLAITLSLHNSTGQDKGLMLVRDRIPDALGSAVQTAIESVAARSVQDWRYELTPEHRGVYSWDTVELRTGAPLGLFWSCRIRSAPARAMVYPRVLPLQSCPLLDRMGASVRQLQIQQASVQQGQDGSTRSLRPYRSGDPMRLVHWRSSARYSELRVRELERFEGGNALVIALDQDPAWTPAQFEQAVIAAASLHHYAVNRYGEAFLWTPQTGMLTEQQLILEALAQVQPRSVPASLPAQPLIWITANLSSLQTLPSGSHCVLWLSQNSDLSQVTPSSRPSLGLCIDSESPFQLQLQRAL